ncbi:hypothetical protein ACIHDR_23660 [Nocardia sp. NPDC052278]|uniref:hypothetical protein n=1 Tax=unclassified Nocardia TaxID=2637762 RepID=UPI0036805CDE
MTAQHMDAQGRFALVAIDKYLDEALNVDVNVHVKRISTLFRELGFEQDHRTGGNSAQEVGGWLAKWKPQTRRLLLYWTGHAQAVGGDVALFGSTYVEDDPMTVLQGALLGQLLARRPAVEIVVIIDACKAGVGIEAITSAFRRTLKDRAYPVGREPGLAVLSSARENELARNGVYATALEHILREGPPPPTDTYAGWTARDELITPTDLYDALRVHLDNIGARQTPDLDQVRSVGGFFPFFKNRQHRPNRPDTTVETLRHSPFAEADLLEHFLFKFRGIDTVTAEGWYYSPRREPQAFITEWLHSGDGILVVTGPPGSGKSALLGWLAAMSSPDYRQHAARKSGADNGAQALPEGAIDAGIHAKQRTLQECVAFLGDALKITPPESGWQEPGPLVDKIADRAKQEQRTITILLDALDEAYAADQTRLAVDLLATLAASPGVRVIVGTRPNREDSARSNDAVPTPDGPWAADGPLIRALTPDRRRVLRLDTDLGSSDAITTYVTSRLLDPTSTSPYRDHPVLAAKNARVIAEHSDGIFLFARLLARSLVNQPTCVDLCNGNAASRLNGGVAEAFAADLHSYGPNRDRVFDLLSPLAWAEGAGLPRRGIWLALANALARPGVSYTEQDIAWVLEHAGAHIIESGEDGQTVYRLYHQAFNDYFQRNIDPVDVQRRITHALLTLVEP